MDRQAAWEILTEYTKNESLVKHALSVEAAMRAYAGKFGEDPEVWGIVGLVHDFDYERYPSAEAGHPFKGAEELRAKGYPESMVKAVLSHADYSGVPRETPMEKTLFACDELCGFITAAALIRPTKSVLDLEASSVKKRMKDKAFARNVKREDIVKGAQELGVDLTEHITFVIKAMQGIADQLGLRGTIQG
ncbi:MAG TPA: HDIG domain-containing protein [Candidatus Acidoferrum sp.]|nr:HDIG domain-containing protein [Candidatus Acidoferrum sp.]